MTVQQYLSYFDEMMEPTIPMFRLVPDDKQDWKPPETAFTAGQLMAHIAISFRFYGKGISRGDWGFESMREIFLRNRRTPSLSAEQAIELLQKTYGEFKESLSMLTDEEFDKGMVNSPQLGRVPRWRLAMLAAEHIVNHRAELFMYLRLLGVKVNTGTLYKKTP